jgi:hypothetical protein
LLRDASLQSCSCVSNTIAARTQIERDGDCKLNTTLRGCEFTISRTSNRAANDMAGLSYDTKFDLKRAIDLPYTSEWFALPPAAPHGQTSKLDILHPSLMLALQAAYRAATE